MVFLSVRILHVLLAVFWIGTTFFTTFFLAPAVQEAGPGGGAVMTGINQRRFQPLISSIAGVTVLSGLWLYWRFTGGFDPAVSQTHAGMAFGIGGVFGFIAIIIAGAVVGRGLRQMEALGRRAAETPEGPARSAVFGEMRAAGRRVAIGSRLVVICGSIAAALMAIGHYI